jgi:hypothetical protein
MHKHLSILVSALVYVSFGVTFTAPASARTYNTKIFLQNLTDHCMLESQDINAINNNLTDSSGKKISIKDIGSAVVREKARVEQLSQPMVTTKVLR